MPSMDLFRYLGKKRFTGSLVVRREAAEKRLFVREGNAVQASSTDPREFVGQILIYGGHLGEEEFEEAFQQQLATSVPLGKILVQLKKVPAPVVRDALEFKIRETGIELCSWREGEFRVSSGEADVQEVDGSEIRPIPLQDLAEAAKVRAAAWERIRAVLPSGATRLGLGQAAGQAKDPVDRRIFSLLDEPRSIDELLLLLHATKFQLYSRLHGLVNDGRLRIEGSARKAQPEAPGPVTREGVAEASRAAPPPLPPRQPAASGGPPPAGREPTTGAPADPDELIARARAALAKDAPDLAVELARKALQLDASREVVAALREAETQLLRTLRAELVGRDLKPEVLIERHRLRELPLTPPARYLLTRMNGEREIGAIVRVAPMREVDALEVIRLLLRDGLIRIRPASGSG